MSRESFLTATWRSLDPRRENFLQSDIDGFAHYRTNLDKYTIGSHETADLTPAFEIYQRFLERLQQHDDYVEELLKQDKFKFTGDDRLDRPPPRALPEGFGRGEENSGANSCATSICRKN